VFWPPIHDITTDPDDPPQFEALLPRRAGRWVSRADYDGPQAAAAQRRAYPDIQPLTVPVPLDRVFEAALAAARVMGWQVVAHNRAAGRIEAIATTRVMRFKDDVVVRLREGAQGVRVDVRSKSRLGRGDLGANARRIRHFASLLVRSI
jgi:uncharacterized protein (DUF1499 family)